MGVERLAASLTRLQDALAEVRLPLDVPGAVESRHLIRAQAAQVEDYVLPRLRRLDAPLLAVVGGSTGAGKSTLVNSLVRRVVSEAGVIRPTTRSSVLVHHPDDQRWFSAGQILPGLARSDVSVGDPRVLHLVAEPRLPRGLAVLDAPDVDSVVAQNRSLADQLLGAADLWLFVTSAARYADAVPWRYLRAAARRKAVVAVVLDRVPPAAASEVPPHLGQMMSQRGLSASPLFAIPEIEVDAEGLLPQAAVAPISGWLADLAADTVRRNQVVLQTLDGAVEALTLRGPEVIDAITAQIEALTTLREDAERSFAEATRSVAAQTADGTLLRGEVLARWQDFVGTGEFFRAVEKRIGLFRDRLARAVRGEPKKAQDVQLAVESGLEVLIREEGEFAARRVVSAWEAHPAGRQLLARDGALGRVSSDFGDAAARVIRQWQGDVLEMVATEGSSKKAAARYLALGVNGAGVALMIFVFSQTGGLVGAEVGIAGGTALLAQRLLEAVFGEDAVRRMAKQAKEQLDARVEALMAAELLRFVRLIDEIDVRAEQAEHLQAAVAALEVERVAEDRFVREVPIGELPSVDDDTDDRLEVPSERFTDDDTGLLPALVSAQLAALAADASRHDEADADETSAGASSDESTSGVDEQIVLGPDDDEPLRGDDTLAEGSSGDDVTCEQPVADVDVADEGAPVALAAAAEAVHDDAAEAPGDDSEQGADQELDQAVAEPVADDAQRAAVEQSSEVLPTTGDLPEAEDALPADREPEADQSGPSAEVGSDLVAPAVDDGGEAVAAEAGSDGELEPRPDDQSSEALGEAGEVGDVEPSIEPDEAAADQDQPDARASDDADDAPSAEPADEAQSTQAAEPQVVDETSVVEPAERPIPVPAGLAELAAEAVRRPWEPRADEQPAEPAAESDDAADASAAQSPTEAQPLSAPASLTDAAEDDEAVLPSPPVLPSAPVLPPPMASAVPGGELSSDVADHLAMDAGGSAEWSSEEHSDNLPGEPADADAAAPSLPAPPVPAPPPMVGTPDAAAVPTFLLIPPDGIPASPPVPSWPDRDDEPAAAAAEEEPS